MSPVTETESSTTRSAHNFDDEPLADVADDEIWHRIEQDLLRQEQGEREDAAAKIQSSYRQYKTHRSGIYHIYFFLCDRWIHLFIFVDPAVGGGGET